LQGKIPQLGAQGAEVATPNVGAPAILSTTVSQP
jgi:hypothetical protein